MVQVKHFKLLRIRVWGCIIGLLVPLIIRPNGAWNKNHLNQLSLSKLSMGLTEAMVNGRPKIDVDTFFNRMRKGLIELIK